MEKERNLYADLLKSLLIILVIFGHFIQYIGYRGSIEFFSDHMWQFIYSFHMPLFIGISGFYSVSSIKKQPFFSFVKSRFLYLFLPMFIWCAIHSIIQVVVEKRVGFIDFIQTLIFNLQYDYWFIWSIIFFSLILAFLNKIKYDNIIVFSFSVIVFSFFIPNEFKYCSIFLLKGYYFFFVLGYWLGSNNIQRIINLCKKFSILIFSISILFLYFWNDEYSYNYTLSYYPVFEIVIFRLLASTAISVSIMLLIDFIYRKFPHNIIINVGSRIGKDTLGIYLIQGVFFYLMLYYKPQNMLLEYRVAVYFCFSILLTLFLYYFIRITSGNKYLALFLYGNKS